MSLSFVLVGSQIKRFRSSLRSLAAIGSELLVEGVPERLVLRAINSARSAFLAVTFSANFFESYNVFGGTALVQAGVLIKHLLATFRTSRVSTMSCELKPQEGALRVTLKCDNGLIKRYGLDVTDAEILQANLDGQDLPVAVVAEASEFNKLLNTFQSTLDEITIIAQPEQQPQNSTAAAVAAAQRAVQIQSFYDPAKGLSGQSLHTSLQLDSHSVFKSYSHQGNEPSDVTVNLKDLKALVALCVDLGVDVSLKFDSPGVPLLAVPHIVGAQEMDYTAELILATLQESQLNDQDHWGDGTTAAAGEGPAAAAVSDGFTTRDNRHTSAGASQSRPETIAPATTYTAGFGNNAAAAAGETPQGRLNLAQHDRAADGSAADGGFTRDHNNNPFAAHQQQQGQQQQHCAAANAAAVISAQSGRLTGLSAGRRSAAAGAGSGVGGRSRSGGGGSGLSRLQRLEAEEESGRLGNVAPYSRLESSMAAAGRSAGTSGAAAAVSGGAAAAVSGGAAAAASGGMRSPGGYEGLDSGIAQPDSWMCEAAAATSTGVDGQQQQHQQPVFASRSLGEFARQQQQWQDVTTGVADVAMEDGTDSQMDPETLPGRRSTVREVFQQHMQAHLQQQEKPQAFGSEQLVEQQQQLQGNNEVVIDDSDAELPETPSDEQQRDGAGFGFL